MSKSFTSKLFDAIAVDELESKFRTSVTGNKEQDVQKVRRIAEATAEKHRIDFINFYSAFTLDGELGLDNALHARTNSRGLLPAVEEAISNGNDASIKASLYASISVLLLDLWREGRLRSIQLVDPLPAAALEDLQELEKYVLVSALLKSRRQPSRFPQCLPHQ